jgi:hypothetical protein
MALDFKPHVICEGYGPGGAGGYGENGNPGFRPRSLVRMPSPMPEIIFNPWHIYFAMGLEWY